VLACALIMLAGFKYGSNFSAGQSRGISAGEVFGENVNGFDTLSLRKISKYTL
jgi:hypothetical protein